MQVREDYVPVIIPTLCRFEHFKRCVESLQNCVGAEETELYISVDYPAKPSHQEGHDKILEFINSGIEGFKDVFVYQQKENLGATRNLYFLNHEVKKNHYASIWSEDDNCFSPNFLLFVNKALYEYCDDDNVFSVSGYGYPLKQFKGLDSYYLFPSFSAWGVGIWYEKYEKEFNKFDSLAYSKSVLHSFSKSYRLLIKNPHVLRALISMVNKNLLYGDTIFETVQTLEGKYTVFPTLSKSRNYGHDGSGLHCTNSDEDIYLNQVIDSSRSLNFEIGKGLENKECEKAMHSYKKEIGGNRFRIIIKYLLYRMHITLFFK